MTGRQPGDLEAAGSWRVVLRVDADTGGFGVSVEVPVSLRSLIAKLPPAAMAVLDWVPEITLNAAGIRFNPFPATQSYGVYVSAGITEAVTGSADFFVATLPDPSGGVAVVAGLQLGTTVDLAGTPLFGSMLSGISIQDLQVIYASTNLPAGAVELPPPARARSPAYVKGFQLAFTVLSGDASEQFVLTPATFRKPVAGELPSGDWAAGVPAAGDRQAGQQVQWFAVQKTFGPLTLGRVGVLTTPGRFGLALDAAIATKAFSLDLSGFTVSFAADNISPSSVRVDLDGLLVAFTAKSVSMTGSLLKTVTPAGTSYDGTLLLQVGKYGITAAGSYANMGGYTSLFVFGLIKGAFGGPPAFFVTGLAAGFGYNRSLRLPKTSEIQQFPLVLAARQGSAYLPEPGVAAALHKLSTGGWVPPEQGQYWLAAGILFTSFQIIESFLLFSVQFGNELIIALLGISSLQLPRAPLGRPFVYIEMVLDVVIRPAAGTVQVNALLTPNSFVLDKACKVTGGFAFYLWFGEKFRGDFVVTMGGYHPWFTRPKHYPEVPRLGVSWVMSPELRLEAGTYFALTPSCVMAGGSLDVAFKAGALRAWFRAWADFIIYWRPFFFHVRIGVSIGASYTLDLGPVHKTFSVELSAEVELWGPPFGGIARVTWWVISFTVKINGGVRPALPGTVLPDWASFAEAFLPPRSEICLPRADRGLTAVLTEGPETDPVTVWLVSPADLALSSETVIPASVLVAGAPGSPLTSFDGPAPGVYPMGSLTIVTQHFLELYWADDEPVDISGWGWAPGESGLPQSLWGTVNNGEPDLDATLVPGLTGLHGAPPEPALTGPPLVSLRKLGRVQLEDGLQPLDPEPVDGATGPPPGNPKIIISDTIMSRPVRDERDGIVAALGELGIRRGLTGGDLSLLAEQAGAILPAPPMLGPPGTTGPRQPASPAVPADPARPASPASIGNPASTAPAALFRRHGQRATAHVFDRWAGSQDRAARAGLGTGQEPGSEHVFRLEPGATVVWDLAPGAYQAVSVDGDAELTLAVFDPQFRLAGLTTLAGPERWPLPAGATLLVVSSEAADQAPDRARPASLPPAGQRIPCCSRSARRPWSGMAW